MSSSVEESYLKKQRLVNQAKLAVVRALLLLIGKVFN